MFVGHYGVSFAAKPMAPRVPLWVWFIATQWLDVLWSILVLLDVERMRVVPGFTEANSYDLYYMPYTHGLAGSIVLSIVLGAVVAAFVSENRARTLFLVAVASFSHWLLDLIVHVADLPLYDNSVKVGFGLWHHVMLSFPLELILLGIGAWLFARSAKFVDAKGIFVFAAFLILLILIQVYANFGPPPTSPKSFAVFAISLYAIMALLAAGLERFALMTPRDIAKTRHVGI